MHRYVRTILTVGGLLFAAGAVEAQIDARLLRQPDVSATQITFVYGGDIWIVAKEGGVAQRLSTPTGEESFPRFSPDGALIGFTGNYDGNQDIFVIPVGGGVPTRVTHHPDEDRMLGWFPDGESILFATLMTSEKQRFRKLYRVPVTGGLPTVLPVPYGEFGAISDDGSTLAYMPLSRDFRTWKRYRGGTAPEIWLFGLTDLQAKNVTQNDANDTQPMWHGSTLYFMSDRDGKLRANIWALDVNTGEERQVTFFEEFDVHFPAIGPHDMVFENGGRLYVMDLATETPQAVEVKVITDRASLRPRPVMVGSEVAGGDISPSGKQAVLEARGEIFTLPAEHGVVRNLTRTSGVAERHPEWSPDGKTLAYFSDRSGEYELTLRAGRRLRRGKDSDLPRRRIPLHAHVVAGQQEDRFYRQPAGDPPHRRRNEGVDGDRPRPMDDPPPARALRGQLVVGQPLDRLLTRARKPPVCGLPLRHRERAKVTR